MEIKKPKTQHQQVLYYLLTWNEFSLLMVIKDSMFHKFQTRLSELEHDHGIFTIKKRIPFKNRFGNTADYYTYQAIDKGILFDLYNKLIIKK